MKKVELSKKEQQETEVLAKRIMPKTDFEKILEHDKLYYNTLNQALEFNVVKQDILGKKCQLLLQNPTREGIQKNIDMLVDWAETQVKVLDMKGKLRIQQKLIEDKETHYENVFMPQFRKEWEEASENFTTALEEAREVASKNEEYFEDIVKNIVYELTWWDKCSSEQQKNEEYIIQIYKPLKRLLGAYKNKKDIQKESEKYSK